jgi:RimJ/RimL family protein N-acetyltransferase
MHTLYTARLVLRPFANSDAAALAELAGEREVAASTLRIPHPYTLADAEEFISACSRNAAQGAASVFAVTLQSGELCGACGLELDPIHSHAEIGYWIGMPYWGQGYATEAAAILVDFGFTHLKLHRIFAAHFVGNSASGRVLQKIGMTYEGRLRGHYLKWGKFCDAEAYGMIESDPRGPSLPVNGDKP